MSDDLVKRIEARAKQNIAGTPFDLLMDAKERIQELQAENKLLNEQMAAIEEHGNEMLNALPDCLMRLAPALVENGELKAKLAKLARAAKPFAAIKIKDGRSQPGEIGRTDVTNLRAALAELKGETDD
jgi:hypothetical protein